MTRNRFRDPTQEDIAAVLAAFEPLRASDANLGHWVGGGEVEPGVLQMPWFECSPAVRAWERALYDRHIVCEYGEDGWHEHFAEIVENPALLQSAGLTTIRRVLTTVVRGERFSGGYIEAMFEAGVAQAAMERLGELHES